MSHPIDSLASTLVQKVEDANERRILAGSGHRADLLVWKNANGELQFENLSAPIYSVNMPPRKTGKSHFNDAGSFVSFVQKHSAMSNQASIYAVMEPEVTFVAVLNDHSMGAPDFRDHRAVFKPRKSAEWETWLGANGMKNAFDGNAEFSKFLLDNCMDMTDPSPADMLSIAANFRATQTQTINSAVRLSDGNNQFTFDNVVQSETKNASGNTISIPEKFQLSIPVFDGLNEPKYELTAMLCHRVNNRELKIWFDLIRHRKVLQQAFSDLVSKISTTGLPLYFGTSD